MRSPRPTVAAALLAAAVLGACTPSTQGPPRDSTSSTLPATRTPRPAPTTAVAFRADRLEDAGWVRNEELSDGTRVQYQDTRCVVQLVVLPATGPRDDAGDTELALAALGEDFANPVDRPDVALPSGEGALDMRAQRVDVDTGTEVLAMQVAMRVLGDAGATVAVTHACYDHAVTDEEFDSVVALLELDLGGSDS
ncbi:MAG: hypothetical protein EOL89_00350 [Actinobacteria bacterium]|nr:hypothetical protein [Actinomycetota bacterium]